MPSPPTWPGQAERAPSARKGFALTGRSQPLDPRHDAVRGDLADVRLAQRVFAPHYAQPLPLPLRDEAALRATRARESAVLATLAAGDVFELLDVTGGIAWGLAPETGLVGYLDAAALGLEA